MLSNICHELVTWRLLVSCMAIIFGTAIPAGLHASVLNAPTQHMEKWYNETIVERYNVGLTRAQIRLAQSIVVAIYYTGGIIGSAIGGTGISNIFGRKIPLLISAIVNFFAAILFIFCRRFVSIEMIFIARLFCGIGAGLATSTSPMYLSELAPLVLRGTFATLFSVGVVSGIVIGQVISMEELLGSENNWHYALSLFVIPVLLFMFLYDFLPESPKYLYIIKKDKKEEAKTVLQYLRGQNTNLEEEIKQMDEEASKQSDQWNLWAVIRDPKLLMPIILVITLQLQLCSVIAMSNYSVMILELIGIDSNLAKRSSLITGMIALCTISFSPLVMAKLNRRFVIQTSAIFSTFFLALGVVTLELAYTIEFFRKATIGVVILFFIAFEFGLGSVTMFLAAELFESGPRSAAMSISSLCMWSSNFISTMTFPIAQLAFDAYAFIPYVFFGVILLILVHLYLPETRNRQTSEVAAQLANGFKSRPILKASS